MYPSANPTPTLQTYAIDILSILIITNNNQYTQTPIKPNRLDKAHAKIEKSYYFVLRQIAIIEPIVFPYYLELEGLSEGHAW